MFKLIKLIIEQIENPDFSGEHQILKYEDKHVIIFIIFILFVISNKSSWC